MRRDSRSRRKVRYSFSRFGIIGRRTMRPRIVTRSQERFFRRVSFRKAEFMRLLLSRVRKLLDPARPTRECAVSRELNTKLINPKECLDFLGRSRYAAGGEGGWRVTERGGKAFRSLSAPPSGMPPSHLYVVAESRDVYVYTRALAHVLRAREILSLADARLLASYIRYTSRKKEKGRERNSS